MGTIRLLASYALLMLALQGHCKTLSRTEAKALTEQTIRQWRTDNIARYAEQWQQKRLTLGSHTMRFDYRTDGDEPAEGYNLYISLHGGGGTTPDVNDSQWRNQLRLYPMTKGVYVCPRSIVDEWDMHCKPQCDTLYEHLVEMFSAYMHIHPDRVFLMGYSAGGDGVYRLAPRMADRWAAASMMAGHPGDVSLVNLRNTPFMVWCGALDDAYDRNRHTATRGRELDSLRQADPEGYPHEWHVVEGKGHWMDRADTAAVAWMERHTRNPYPTRIVWRQEEKLRAQFHYLSVPPTEMARGKEVRMEREGNTFRITRCDYRHLTLWLNDDMVDLDRPVTIFLNGKKVFKGRLKRSAQTIQHTMTTFRDPRFVFSANVTVGE